MGQSPQQPSEQRKRTLSSDLRQPTIRSQAMRPRPPNLRQIRIGDFNDKIGRDDTNYEEVMRTHGLGEMSKNRESFVNACALNKLVMRVFLHNTIHNGNMGIT